MIFLKEIAPVLLFISICFLSNSCTSGSFGQQADSLFLVTEKVKISYNLKKPVEKHYLPYILEEISGLSFKQPNRLLAVDDESGRVFEYDLKQRKIIHSMAFNKADDYEGVEIVNDQIYVLKSDGDIFMFAYSNEKEVESEKFENDLSSKNDTEGLGYDAKKNILLIACKEDPEIGSSKIEGKAFYSFDLKSKKLNSEPIFTIGPKQLKTFWEENKSIEYDTKRIKFKPSAIATHPLSGDYYIISSIGKMLIVVSNNGQIKATYPISPRILGQPEGLCFAPNGDIYISSEGEGDRGYIQKFRISN